MLCMCDMIQNKPKKPLCVLSIVLGNVIYVQYLIPSTEDDEIR